VVEGDAVTVVVEVRGDIVVVVTVIVESVDAELVVEIIVPLFVVESLVWSVVVAKEKIKLN
jgi:hypothetical protein